MQLKSQAGESRDWKVIAAVATASVLGVSGLALADTGSSDTAPDAINLRDQTQISQLNSQVEMPSSEFPPLVFSVESPDDSPLDDNSPDIESVDDPSPDVDTVDVDTVSAASVSAESVSVESVDSGAEDSFDDSADS